MTGYNYLLNTPAMDDSDQAELFKPPIRLGRDLSTPVPMPSAGEIIDRYCLGQRLVVKT